jgi:hypothetical protein
MGPTIGPQRDGLTFQEHVSIRQSSCPFDDLRQAVGDILLLREDTDFVILTMYLNGAIELELKAAYPCDPEPGGVLSCWPA